MKNLLLSLFCLTFCVNVANSQFYNGHQMEFGKNRVQYNRYLWQFYRFDRFDTYFCYGGKELAEYTARYAMTELPRLESFFEYPINRRIIFLIYNKLSDFRQSNIGLSGANDDSNIGGVTRIIDNKVFIYFDGDHQKFRKQISAAIAEVILNDMMYGGNVREKLASSTLLNMPEWYQKGLISYVSNNWDMNLEDKVKDGILSGKYKRFNHLQDDDAMYAGHSIWNYIAENYGKSVIPNIVYMTRINKNTESGFMFVLGFSLKELSENWLDFYKTRFNNDNNGRQEYGTNKIVKRPRKETNYYQMKISPDGRYFAYVTNKMGRYKVILYDNETKKKRVIFRREKKVKQIYDYSYPILAWHPKSKLLALLTEHQGSIKILNYFVEEKRFGSADKGVTRAEETKVFAFEKVLDFSFAHDGLGYVFSAMQKGQIDIFVHNILSNTDEQITDDLYDDLNPRFADNSHKIIFSSNRIADTLSTENSVKTEFSPTFDLFMYDYQNKSKQLIRISGTKYENETNPIETQRNTFQYLSDETGVINKKTAQFDSIISAVDTITHFRYFATSSLITNYSRNILEHEANSSANISMEKMQKKGKFYIFKNPMDANQEATKPNISNYKKEYTEKLIMQDSAKKEFEIKKRKYLQRLDSLRKIQNQPLGDADTIKVDINNYVFEKEKQNPKDIANNSIASQIERQAMLDTLEMPLQRVYKKSFYINSLVNQIDFTFLNTNYQQYTGGAVYFNPGASLFTQIGTQDLFEDYKITGGYRLSGDFYSTEYLFSIENLKKRLDKQFIYHRQAYRDYNQEQIDTKVISNSLIYLIKYPITQVSAIKASASLRYDYNGMLANSGTLTEDPKRDVWAGGKLEYVYDDTRNIDININEGTRFKIFGEYYRKIASKNSELYVWGLDIRNYIRIHRNLIWANRLAVSSSMGTAKLIYYLGGVDNWMNFSSKTEMFNRDIPIDTSANYVYQAVATNMRGFSQNIRNGNNFAVLNSEIRWPIIKYLINRPMSNDFLSSLQVVGFVDVGSAWTGTTPNSGKNAYDYNVINTGSVKVVMDSQRSPVVFGVGYGLRARLFGYYVRLDWAHGIENNVILPKVFYFSLSLDF